MTLHQDCIGIGKFKIYTKLQPPAQDAFEYYIELIFILNIDKDLEMERIETMFVVQVLIHVFVSHLCICVINYLKENTLPPLFLSEKE